MSEPKLISPLLDGYIMGEPMSDHHGVRCCPAIREDADERYIVKIISIPASQVQLDALLLTGAYSDQAQALAYFEELAGGVIGEVDILNRLNRLEGFLPYLGHQIQQMDEGVGYQVYLISPYKRSLETQMRVEPLTHLGAVNLGLDLCAALAACRRAGYLYIDLKPTNIFITQTQGCCIGDLGFMPLDSLKYASLPEKYRSSYTAPEIADAMASLNDTIDIYALGLVLYQVYNNGQLPFEGSASDQELPPPMYADYEMAEIILKACAPDPADRWQDPAQMGQALVNYMQRNSVNDTSIVPPPLELADEPEDEAEEEFLSEDENEAAMAPLMAQVPEEEPPEQIPEPAEDAAGDETDLSFMDDPADETVPTEESAAELQDAPVTEEVAEMLAQADELICHELPEPAVAPDPIDIPFPPPIVLDAEEDAEPEAAEVVEAPPAEQEEAAPRTEENADDGDAQTEDAPGEEEAVITPPPRKKKKKGIKIKPKILITAAIVLVLLAGLITGGYCYYNYIYLQTIDGITIHGTVDTLTVSVSSNIDDELLTVVCTDTYGNTHQASVSDGTAKFTNLTPNTQYRITMEISGMHQLQGTTTGSFTTAAQTEVLNFTAIAGSEDGTAILSFTVTGPEGDRWAVEYFANGSDTKTVEFSGHTVTVSGLEVGTEYTFRLRSQDDLYLIGQCELKYTAQQIVYAQDVKITACGGGSLSAEWTLPEGMTAQGWTVRCCNDAGFDETITTENTSAVFTVPDHTTSYTVTVTANGMTQSASTTVSANPITVTKITAEPADTQSLALNWEFTGEAPLQGWLITYSVDGGTPQLVTGANNAVTVPLYPGCHYEIDIRPVDEVSYFAETFSYDTQEVESFEGYWVDPSEMRFALCRTPDVENWDRHDLEDADYTTEFASGENVSLLVRLRKQYLLSDDEIVTTFIVCNSVDQPLTLDTQTSTWNDMWHQGYCELDLPQVPTAPGSYSVQIYFNGLYVTTQYFTVI